MRPFEKNPTKNTLARFKLIPNFKWHMFCLFFCAGCQSSNPGYATLKALISPTAAQFDASYDYISIQSDTSNGRMILGYRQLQEHKLIEHWYTGAGEMIETVDGRLHKALGTTSEIRRNTSQAPSWQTVSESRIPVTWERQLDIMPGYRFGLVEQISTRQLTEVEIPVVPGIEQRGLVWFQDEVQTKDIQGQTETYRQLFAVKNNQLIYSEQCISEKLCMRIQSIPRAVK